MKRCCHDFYILPLFFMLGLSACSHLFYYPSQRMYVDVGKLSSPPRQIEFTNDEGEKIIGWYFQAPSRKPKARLLFFHGNAENISSHFLSLYWILREDYDFLIFDYPGYGGSEGQPTQKSTTDSGQKALQWLSAQQPSLPVVIFGQSLGGNIALYTAAQHKTPELCLVVVESTFKSYRKVAQRILAQNWWSWPVQFLPYLVVSENYSARDYIDEIAPVPLVVIHAEKDNIVESQNGRDVYEAAQEPKEYWTVPGSGHIQAFTGDHQQIFRQKLLDSLKKNCVN